MKRNKIGKKNVKEGYQNKQNDAVLDMQYHSKTILTSESTLQLLPYMYLFLTFFLFFSSLFLSDFYHLRIFLYYKKSIHQDSLRPVLLLLKRIFLFESSIPLNYCTCEKNLPLVAF